MSFYVSLASILCSVCTAIHLCMCMIAENVGLVMKADGDCQNLLAWLMISRNSQVGLNMQFHSSVAKR